MEHRYSRRLKAGLMVELFVRQHRMGRFTTRDVSVDGMFLETEAPLQLRRNEPVEVQLLREEWVPPRGRPTLRALVAHVGKDGVGVLVLDGDQRAYKLMLNRLGYQRACWV